ncbi:unnamed protein product [marine sediment metagenome]|uniref:Uncharacterized protein n=1 Tax=marine sediment metagenome TaxID=412755 RepID=X1VBW2_9ZZZZ
MFQYLLSTEWDISTATYIEKSKYVGDEDTYPFGLSFKPDGSKMYIMGYLNKTIYQYSLPLLRKFLKAVLSIAENESILSIEE